MLTYGNKRIELPAYRPTEGPDAIDIRKLYSDADVFTYDPDFTSTASCESNITFIDGDKGILLYRGYPIDQLAKQAHFLEVCYLLLYGELPNASQMTGIRTHHHLSHDGARTDQFPVPRIPSRCASHGGDGRRGRRAVGILSRLRPTSRTSGSARSRVIA